MADGNRRNTRLIRGLRSLSIIEGGACAYSRHMMLQRKIALVTGGSSGIGLSLARRLVQAGASVALVARTREKLESAADALRREPNVQAGTSRVMTLAADVADRAALDRLPQAVVDALGGLDIVVNNAGVNHRGLAMGHSPAELAQIIDVNLTAPVYLSRRALDVLRPGGAIIQISSLAGKVPFAEQATYSASKSGLRFFSRALAEELESRDIHVLCVNPGPVDTDFFEDVRKASDITFSQPMSTADEVADATLRGLALKLTEVDLPQASGWLATLGYLSPGLKRALRPMLARRGARNKEQYLRKKGLL